MQLNWTSYRPVQCVINVAYEAFTAAARDHVQSISSEIGIMNLHTSKQR